MAIRWRCFCISIIVINLFCLCQTHGVPQGWERICSSEKQSSALRKYVGDEQSSNNSISMMCKVDGKTGIDWNFRDLRDWAMTIPDISLFVTVTCYNEGEISLPWPMKAPGLVGLVIKNCKLKDKYADFNNPLVSELPDSLRVLEIRNSIWVRDTEAFTKMTSLDNLQSLTPDYDCGQDSTIEYLVMSNVTDSMEEHGGIQQQGNEIHFTRSSDELDLPHDFVQDASVDLSLLQNVIESPAQTPPTASEEEMLLNLAKNESGALAIDDMTALINNLHALDIKCRYEMLRVIDESFPLSMSKYHFTFMVKGASYPALRIMNYSRSGLENIPNEVLNFDTYFPKLEYADFSLNRITQVPLRNLTSLSPRNSSIIFDLRFNQIKSLDLKEVYVLEDLDEIFVDIRGNPFHCDCKVTRLVQAMEDASIFQANFKRYGYLKDLECASPPAVKGYKLSKLNHKEIFSMCSDIFIFEEDGELSRAKSNDSNSRFILPQNVGLIVGCCVIVLVLSIVMISIIRYKVSRGWCKRQIIQEKKQVVVGHTMSTPGGEKRFPCEEDNTQAVYRTMSLP